MDLSFWYSKVWFTLTMQKKMIYLLSLILLLPGCWLRKQLKKQLKKFDSARQRTYSKQSIDF